MTLEKEINTGTILKIYPFKVKTMKQKSARYSSERFQIILSERLITRRNPIIQFQFHATILCTARCSFIISNRLVLSMTSGC